MTLFNKFPNFPLFHLGIYSSVVNLIHRKMLTKNTSTLENITSAARVTVLLRSRMRCGISTYYVTTGSYDFLVVFTIRYVASG